ncbi:hypothetical protein [Sphingomonas sp. Leaf242]|uniref:hypothetical protein n=1 Tax=Sphingomonas sp. Leaf242 TaxID=1736304 RepID=UPI0007123DCD|nr:hypothetical protein [Sphingomonas sp. Leaf242]KQO13298.1 hypothetical protein ASF09_03345 [Sphingomonas sp. Leaf242]
MVTDESLRTTKNATAAMFTVLVQVLEQRMPGIEAAFLERLGQAFAETKNDSDDLNGVELMRWTQSLLSGFDHVHGQGSPFLEGR